MTFPPVPDAFRPSIPRWQAAAERARESLSQPSLSESINPLMPMPADQPDSTPAERFLQRHTDDQPRRVARQAMQTKQAEYRDTRRQRRPDEQQKPRGLDIVTDWLARECASLASMMDAREEDEQAHAIGDVPTSLEDAQRRLHTAQAVRVSIRQMADSLTPCERPTAQAVAGDKLAALKPKRGKGAGTEGAGRLWRLLHLLAVYKAERQRHHSGAAQEVMHSAGELLAAALRVCARTITRWSADLERAGLIEARAHYTDDLDVETGEVVTRIDGTVYAIALQSGHAPRLTYGDLHHRYRNLPTDRATGRTAYRYAKLINARQDEEKNMSESTTSQCSGGAGAEQVAFRVLQAWAVTPGGGADLLDARYSFDPDIIPADGKTSMQTVIYALPLIADEQDGDRRRVLVHRAAVTVAATLGDDHSRRYYAGLIWQALGRGWKGLQALAAQLARFEVDRREWGNQMHHAPALLTSRTHRTAAA